MWFLCEGRADVRGAIFEVAMPIYNMVAAMLFMAGAIYNMVWFTSEVEN